MNPDWLLKHFEQISEAPDAVRHIWPLYLDYYDRVAPISQMASGQSQDALLEPSVRIVQKPSAKSATTFPLKKRLIEWAEEELQGESGRR